MLSPTRTNNYVRESVCSCSRPTQEDERGLEMSVANKLAAKPFDSSKKTLASRGVRPIFAKKEMPNKLLILDPDLIRELIRERRERGADRYDEVWEGVYIVPPLATNAHQGLTVALAAIAFNVITLEGRGQAYAGANVSDRRFGWKRKFRAPDVVVVLTGSRAVDCNTHWMGGPDFLVEVQSPGDQTEEKIPFYSEIRARELLIVHRDTRRLRLYRHNGTELAPVKPTDFQDGKWLVSEVVPLAFRRKAARGGALTEVQRTDGVPGNWTI
jgi:Uma2 family endonuclease